MRPLLALHADGDQRTQKGLRDALAREFDLSGDDLDQRLPSGTAKTCNNRVGWRRLTSSALGFSIARAEQPLASPTGAKPSLPTTRTVSTTASSTHSRSSGTSETAALTAAPQPDPIQIRPSRRPRHRKRRSRPLTRKSGPRLVKNICRVSLRETTLSLKSLSSMYFSESGTAVRSAMPPSAWAEAETVAST